MYCATPRGHSRPRHEHNSGRTGNGRCAIEMLTRKGGSTVSPAEIQLRVFLATATFRVLNSTWNCSRCWHQTWPPVHSRKVFVLPQKKLPNHNTWMPCIVISCHCLSVAGLGHLCACCLSRIKPCFPGTSHCRGDASKYPTIERSET